MDVCVVAKYLFISTWLYSSFHIRLTCSVILYCFYLFGAALKVHLLRAGAVPRWLYLDRTFPLISGSLVHAAPPQSEHRLLFIMGTQQCYVRPPAKQELEIAPPCQDLLLVRLERAVAKVSPPHPKRKPRRSCPDACYPPPPHWAKHTVRPVLFLLFRFGPQISPYFFF